MVSLKFHDLTQKKDFIEIESFNDRNILVLKIKSDDNDTVLVFDKSTAIKISKELRKQIALLF